MIVVDTNVLVYLLTGSGPWERAVRFLSEDPEWAAPPILLSEIRNVLVGLVRRGVLQDGDAQDICREAEALLGDRVVNVSSGPIIQVALDGGLSAYDAEFVVLARQLGIPLVTADRAILDGAPDVAVPLWESSG